MFSVKNFIKHIVLIFITVLPVMQVLIATILSSLIFMAFAIGSLFFAVWFLPYVKGYESLWMFVFSAVFVIPINIKVIILMFNSVLFDTQIFVFRLLVGILFFIILFCVEEIVLGVVTRLIWKHQKAIDI